MADAIRLVRIGVPAELAAEIARQIDAGQGDVTRLSRLGMATQQGAELAAQIGGGGDALRLIRLGVPLVVAQEISAQVDGGDPSPGTAPIITQQPSITPSSATVGDSVTINLGAATGAVGDPTWTLMLGGVDVTDQAIGDPLAYEATAAGTLTLAVTWTNATGSTVATPAVIEVEDAPAPGVDLEAVSYMHMDGALPFTGTAEAITGFTAEGTDARAFTIVGTGAEVGMDPARGPLFASGKYARNTGNTVSIADGVMVLVEYDVDTPTDSDTIMALTGGITVNMRWVATSNRMQYNYNVSGASVNQNGVVAAPLMNVMAIEFDRVAETIRYWDGEKIVTLTGQTITSPAFTTIDFGQSLIGAVTRANVIARADGAAWPVSFEDALNEYGAGITPPFP